MIQAAYPTTSTGQTSTPFGDPPAAGLDAPPSASAHAIRRSLMADFTREAVAKLPAHGPSIYRLLGSPFDDETDEEMVLLYVGATVTPRARLRRHLSDARFSTVTRVAVEGPYWSSALPALEQAAISTEGPVWNAPGYVPDRAWT